MRDAQTYVYGELPWLQPCTARQFFCQLNVWRIEREQAFRAAAANGPARVYYPTVTMITCGVLIKAKSLSPPANQSSSCSFCAGWSIPPPSAFMI